MCCMPGGKGCVGVRLVYFSLRLCCVVWIPGFFVAMKSYLKSRMIPMVYDEKRREGNAWMYILFGFNGGLCVDVSICCAGWVTSAICRQTNK